MSVGEYNGCICGRTISGGGKCPVHDSIFFTKNIGDTGSRYCSKCGNLLRLSDYYCSQCGEPIIKSCAT